jgi:transposase
VREMEEEIRRLRMENEFLKKAAAFFAWTQP